MQIDLLVLDRFPNPLDEDIVPPSPFSIHADFDVILDEQLRESHAGELRALVRIEYLRLAIACQRLLDSLNTEGRVEAD